MRKLSLIALILLVVGCGKNLDSDLLQLQGNILHGVIDDENEDATRVYLDNQIRIRWNKADVISVFNGTTRNEKYEFLGRDGSSGGDFEQVSSGSIGAGNQIDHIYALYPYDKYTEYVYADNENNAENDYLLYTLPNSQTYKAKSIGLESNLMVAITENTSDGTLVFRNVCSYLRLKLYGTNQKVKSVVFKGNSNEVLTGDVAITPVYGGTPSVKMLGDVDDDNKTITLNCSDGIVVGSTKEEATEFWMVIPPLNFSKGFTITVYGDDNKSQEYVFTNNLTFDRNKYNTITRELTSCLVTIPTNQIWYTATAKIEPNNYSTSYWPSYYRITSNEWDETTGKGVITFSEEVTSIGDNVFSEKSRLTSIILPNTITYIGDYAFEDCSNLRNITIPNSVNSIGMRAFKDCSKLEEFYGKFASEDGNCLIVDGLLTAFAPVGITEYTIPENVTKIGVWVFNQYPELTKITIHNGVTKIGDGAFAYCSGLTDITVPENVTEIGEHAFYGCTKLGIVYMKCTTPPSMASSIFSTAMKDVKIYVPKDCLQSYSNASSWSDYANYLVAYDFEKGEVVLHSISYKATAKVEPYSDSAFGATIVSNEWDSSTGNGTIYFNNEITAIGEYAFYNCSSLTNITIPETVTEIGKSAFGYCAALDNIQIPGNVTKIGESAFYGCNSLTSITIPQKVTEISNYTFGFCTNLTNITIPNSVTKIGSDAFRKCINLKSITIPDSVKDIDNSAFENCSSLTSINIPENITKISSYLFSGCSSLASITIPQNVTEIDSYAFKNCTKLTSITIPQNVTLIRYYAFDGCTSLSNVYCKPTTPPSVEKSYGSWNAFNNNSSQRKIYVPEASVETYKTAEGWSVYSYDIKAE